MEPLPPLGTALTCMQPGSPYAREARAPDPEPADRFAVFTDDRFDRLDALRCVYIRDGARTYFVAAAKLAGLRPGATLLSAEPRALALTDATLARALRLNAARTRCQRALADAHDDEARFLARAAAMRAVIAACGTAGFVADELPGARALALAAPELPRAAFARLAAYLDDIAYCCICAVLIGMAQPSVDKLLACIGRALVRRTGGALLVSSARALARAAYKPRWVARLLAARSVECTLLFLVAVGARYSETVAGEWTAEATRGAFESCARWAFRGTPRWVESCVACALSVVEIWRVVHASAAAAVHADLAWIASRAALGGSAIDASVDRIVDALFDAARAAEIRRRVPRKMLLLALSAAATVGAYANFRDALVGAIRNMHFDFAAEVVKCATSGVPGA